VTNTVSSDVSSKFSTEGTLISVSIRSTPLQEQRTENSISLMLIVIKSVLQWRDNQKFGEIKYTSDVKLCPYAYTTRAYAEFQV